MTRLNHATLDYSALSEADGRRARMRALHHQPRSRSAPRRQSEGVKLGLYFLRLTANALSFGLLLAAFLSIFYFM